ncbi:hypothetical protein PYCC9005_004087 [Savitreella phatthalungensis]
MNRARIPRGPRPVPGVTPPAPQPNLQRKLDRLQAVRPPIDPKKYKKAERSVVGLIVGIPFVIVTSWILYKRVVLGEEQRIAPQAASKSVTVTDSIATPQSKPR